jgi:hypothetical protein
MYITFPPPHAGQSNPLSRYTIPSGTVLLYRPLAANPPQCAALIAELIQLDALIEAKRALVEPDILTGMEIAYDLILLQISATCASSSADALLRRLILQGFAPRTGTFGLLSALLSDERQLQKYSDVPCAAAPQEQAQPLLAETVGRAYFHKNKSRTTSPSPIMPITSPFLTSSA